MTKMHTIIAYKI